MPVSPLPVSPRAAATTRCYGQVWVPASQLPPDGHAAGAGHDHPIGSRNVELREHLAAGDPPQDPRADDVIGALEDLPVEGRRRTAVQAASYQASPDSSGSAYDPYWIFGHQAAWLLWAGLPAAALGVVGLVRRAPRGAIAILPLALVLIMVAWGCVPSEFTNLRPGEVERTWSFLYPLVAGTAGPVVEKWTRPAGRWRGALVAALVIVSVAQAILLQSLWDNEVSKPLLVFDLDCLP